jgi:hypothetical protein
VFFTGNHFTNDHSRSPLYFLPAQAFYWPGGKDLTYSRVQVEREGIPQPIVEIVMLLLNSLVATKIKTVLGNCSVVQLNVRSRMQSELDLHRNTLLKLPPLQL